MTRCLIACYSLTGTTARVAQALAARLSADLEVIQEARPRSVTGGRLRAVLDIIFKRKPALAPTSKRTGDYDVVVLGCPVWAQNMASPMRSYISCERRNIKKIAVFCTEMSAGGEAVLRQMAALAAQPAIAELVLADKDFRSGAVEAMLDRFARQISPAEATPSAPADAA